MEKERLKEIIKRSNNPGQLIPKEGKNHLIHVYQKDVTDLIVYIRELEKRLDIKSVYLHE